MRRRRPRPSPRRREARSEHGNDDARLLDVPAEFQSHVTLSIGAWSGVPAAKDDPAELMKRADTALYEAKRRGRNQLVDHRELGA